MAEVQTSPMIRLPQISLAEELESALPLEHIAVQAQVTGPIATVAVTQRFGNPLKEPAELDYLFPLPEEAAIVGFELRIGDRAIQGDLQESQAARDTYNQARSEGKRAGLFEQRRPNLFAVRLANVQPEETVQAVVRYQQRVRFDDGVYEFVYPMGITPKYDSPEHPGEGEGVHAPVAGISERIAPVEIELAVDAGIAVEEPSSPSHPIQASLLDERRFQVSLTGEQRPDHDFVLRYAAAGEQVQAAGWVSGEAGKEVFLATLVPPRMAEDQAAILPREFIFVLDRSGSMSGEPIAQARNALRACLRALNPEDTFRILLFDNTLEWFKPEPSPVNQAEVDQADAYLGAVQGRGGTEIVQALQAVLSLPPDPTRSRTVVFLTDGAVSAEMRALEQIRGQLGAARLFTFGIGPAVNRALLSRMARLGRGRATFLQLNEDIEGAIIRFQDSVSFPVLSDLTLEWENAKAWDVYPARLPELYAGEPLEISGRLARSGDRPVHLTLRGKRGGEPVQIRLALPEPQAHDPAIGRVWARARVEDLLEQQELEPRQADKLKAEILGIAMEYNLVSVYTSFVAVDQQPTTGGQPRVIHVAQPLPPGLFPGMVHHPGGGLPRLQNMGVGFAAAAMSPSASLGRAMPARKMADDSSYEAMRVMPPVPMAPGPAREPAREKSDTRWLARTQKLDGSWNGDVERTAAALLAFVRAGHTTRSGSFRQALRKAARWLVEHPGRGLAAFTRARALEELAAATGDETDRSAAQAARLILPQPAGPLETAAVENTGQPPAAIHSLDDLRLAALLNQKLPVPDELLEDELAHIWALALHAA